MRARITLAAGAAILAAGVAGCGGSSSSGGTQAAKTANPKAPEASPAGDIPDNQAYVRFTPPAGGFSVKVPEGWARSSAGHAVTFTDKLNTIRLESAGASSAPTVQATRRTEVPKLAQSVKGFQAGTVSTVSRQAGTAVKTTYLANAPRDPVTGKARRDAVERYDFFHTGRRVTLTLSGPKGADNVDPWRIVTDSVRWSR